MNDASNGQIQGFTPVLCTLTPGGVPEDDFIDLMLEREVAGIVFVSGLHADTTANPARYLRLVERGLPIGLVNGHNEAVPAPSLSTDDRVAARLAVSHLADLGHERIGLAVGPRRFFPVIRKVADDTGAAVVLVEQHVMLALEIADTAMVLAHGDVALHGDAKALAADETLIERAYLGGPENA